MRFLKEAFLGRDISVLGFGSAAVLGRVGKSESLRALETAFDVGINVFDTARAYGYGESEALLGEFFKGRRSEVVICSKFGIMPAAQSALMRMAKPGCPDGSAKRCPVCENVFAVRWQRNLIRVSLPFPASTRVFIPASRN